MSNLQDFRFFLTLLYRPRRTMRELASNGRGHSAACLVAALFGVFCSLRLQHGLMEGSSGLFLYIPAGVACGVAVMFFLAMLVRNFGRWFGGQAELRVVRTAVGLGLSPWTILTALLCATLFSGLDAAVVSALLPFFFVIFLYGYVLLLLTTMAALGLSAFRATLTLAISMAVAFFIIATAARLFIP